MVHERIDLFFNQFRNTHNPNVEYRDLEISDLVVSFYLNGFLNEQNFVQKISDENLLALQIEKFIQFENKSRFRFKSLLNPIKDFLRVLKYLKYRNNYDCDVFLFVPNIKFLTFFSTIIEHYRTQNVTLGIIFWDEKDCRQSDSYNTIFPKPIFPKFTSRAYWAYHEYTAQIDRIYSVAKMLKGKRVLIPEGCLSSMHLLGLMSKKFEFKTLCLQWGFFGRTTVKSGWRNMPFDRFLVWGDFFKSQFGKYNQNLEICVSGHPTLNQSVNSDKSYILFCLQKELGDHIKYKDLRNFIDLMFKIIKENTCQKFVVRTHPDLNSRNIPDLLSANIANMTIHDFDKVHLNDSLSGATMCIGISSTTILESLSMNCFPVFVKMNSLPLQVHEIFNEMDTRFVCNQLTLAKLISDFKYSNEIELITRLKKMLFKDNFDFSLLDL